MNDFIDDDIYFDDEPIVDDVPIIDDIPINTLCDSPLDNFPYLEDDFDSITDYQLFSKGFEYLDDKKADKDSLSNFVTKDVDDLTYYTKTSDLATVATSGSYTDLSNKPTIPDVSNFITKDVNDLTYYTKTSDLASVATTGSYTDLSNKPTIPDVSNFITKDVNDLTYYTKTSDLASVATTGSYTDLSNKPTIPDVSNFITKDVNDLTYYTKTSDLASVATSGSYTDLSNKPTIPDVSNFITIDSGSNTNGNYIKYSNGDMIQTGTIECSANTNYGNVTFPVAFFNNSYNLMASNIYTSGTDYGGTTQLRCISTPQAYNTSGGYIYSVLNDGTVPTFKRKINWIAIGKWK